MILQFPYIQYHHPDLICAFGFPKRLVKILSLFTEKWNAEIWVKKLPKLFTKFEPIQGGNFLLSYDFIGSSKIALAIGKHDPPVPRPFVFDTWDSIPVESRTAHPNAAWVSQNGA